MLRRVAGGASLLRLRPFDISTPDGRSRERYRRAAWSMTANLLSTALNVVTLLAAVPLTLPYLGSERFGVWMTIASLIGLLSFLDLGVGNGLINHVSHAQANEDPKMRVRQVVSRGLALLTVIALLACAAAWPLLKWVDWSWVLKSASKGTIAESRSALVVFAGLFALNIPLGGAAKVFVGLQRGWIPYGIKAIASLASLAALYVASKQQMGIAALLLATYGIQVTFQLVLPVLLIREGLCKFRGLFASHGAWRDLRSISSSGGLFFALQIGTMIGWGADPIIVSSVLGPANVASLAIVQRLFQFVTVPLAILNAPLWTAYADARARGDGGFIRRTLLRSMSVTISTAFVLSLMIVLSSSYVISHWVDHAIYVPITFVAIYAVWSIMDAAGNAFGMFMNGVNEIRIQLMAVALFCPLALILKWKLTQQYGLNGLVVGTMVSYILSVPLLYIVIFRQKISEHWLHQM